MEFSFTVKSNGINMGTYQGDSEEEAFLAYLRDAGYDTAEEASSVIGMDPKDDLVIEPV